MLFRSRPLLSTVRLADRLEIPVLWLESGSPGQLVLELTALVRAPEQVRARTIERLLRQLSSKRTGQDILATAGTVLSARVSLMTSDGSCILGDTIEVDPRLHLDQAVPQRGEQLLVHPVLDPQVNRLAAWLACPFERAADVRLDVLAVGLAMTEPFIRSWLSGQRAQADRDSVFRAQLVSEIVAGRDSVSRDVVEGAVSLGWRLPGWHVGIHVHSDADAPVDRERIVDQLTAGLAGHGIELVASASRGNGWAMWITTDDEPAHRRQFQGAPPGRVGLGRGLGRVATEEEGGQGGGVHDPLQVVDDGQLEPGVGARGAEAGGDVHGPDHRVGVEQVAHPAALDDRPERLDHGHPTCGRQLGHGRRAGLQRRDAPGVLERDAGQHLAAVEAAALHLLGGVGRVDRRDRAAGHGHAVERDGVLRDVGRHDRQARARPEAARLQAAGQRPREPVERGVGEIGRAHV